MINVRLNCSNILEYVWRCVLVVDYVFSMDKILELFFNVKYIGISISFYEFIYIKIFIKVILYVRNFILGYENKSFFIDGEMWLVYYEFCLFVVYFVWFYVMNRVCENNLKNKLFY